MTDTRLTSAQYLEATKKEKHGRIPRASKERRTVNGIVFDSLKEAKRYQTLKFSEIAGTISRLECQPKFEIIVNGEHVCNWFGDFSYLNASGQFVVEDIKSEFTRKDPVYRIKKKLVEALYGIEIVEVI